MPLSSMSTNFASSVLPRPHKQKVVLPGPEKVKEDDQITVPGLPDAGTTPSNALGLGLPLVVSWASNKSIPSSSDPQTQLKKKNQSQRNISREKQTIPHFVNNKEIYTTRYLSHDKRMRIDHKRNFLGRVKLTL